MITTDYLVIGSGVAGLTFAIKMAEKFKDKKVCVVTKKSEDDSNTKYAQGGVAIVLDTDNDSFQKHIQDTLRAGDGYCDESVVKMVIEEGPERLSDLLQWGADFDLDHNGDFDLGREGGHSESRIVHHKDITGQQIEMILLKKVHELSNIILLNFHFAIDLITEHQVGAKIGEEVSCYGAYVLNQETSKVETIRANATLLATGGVGRIYGHTTNPIVATGDGIAMAYRAKAQIGDMEFIQFHPTAFYNGHEGHSFLISEAVRGFGAYLRNSGGYRFMLDYDDRGELASRDIVARGIDKELKGSGDSCVFLDCTHLDAGQFKSHFPNIYLECLEKGIDIHKNWIPVVPAAHYLCGGIVVDKNGRTSVKNLFAGGECARTGLHGANRLASNSLLEALVYAHNSFTYFLNNEPPSLTVSIPDWSDEGTLIRKEDSTIEDNLKDLQKLMRDYAGIVRNNDSLLNAVGHLNIIYREVDRLYRASKVNAELCELRNMVNVAHSVVGQSLTRKENKGVYFNEDYPKHLSMVYN